MKNSKHQAPQSNKLQLHNSNDPAKRANLPHSRFLDLELGISLDFGAWKLDFSGVVFAHQLQAVI